MEAALRARVLEACNALAGLAPRTVSLHRHPETRLLTGSAHLDFSSPAHAVAAVVAIDGRLLDGDKLFAELAAERGSPGFVGATFSGGRDKLSLMKAALIDFAESHLAQDLPHAGGLTLVGSEVSPVCELTPSFARFWERSGKVVAAAPGDTKGGATRLYDALVAASADLAASGRASTQQLHPPPNPPSLPSPPPLPPPLPPPPPARRRRGGARCAAWSCPMGTTAAARLLRSRRSRRFARQASPSTLFC